MTAPTADETVVVTCIQCGRGDAMSELHIGVKHVDGRKYYRPATWAEVRKVERETPDWKGKLRPGDGPNVPVPFFHSKELDGPGGEAALASALRHTERTSKGA